MGCDPLGYLPLRQALAEYLIASRGVKCGPEQVAIVSGVQEALDLVARLFLNPGDRVCMETPGYSGAALVFQAFGAKISGVLLRAVKVAPPFVLLRTPPPMLPIYMVCDGGSEAMAAGIAGGLGPTEVHRDPGRSALVGSILRGPGFPPNSAAAVIAIKSVSVNKILVAFLISISLFKWLLLTSQLE